MTIWFDPFNRDYEAEARDLSAVLVEVHRFLCRFVAFPTEHDAIAATLWVAHTHVVETFDSTPRIAFLSPEPGSGKSRALEVIGALVPAPMHAVNATPAALFRAVSDLEHKPTILFDEIDTVFGPKAKDNEEVRGFLNAGHRRGAVAYRCVGLGTQQKVVPFPAFCAVALAGLNDLPDTITTRSVIVRMRRRAPHEHVEPFRFRIHEPEGNKIGQQLSDALVGLHLDVDPALPDGISDRPADVWEPLLSVADAAGGDWPQRARDACLHHVNESRNADPTISVRLLIDLRAIWEAHGDPDSMFTDTIIEELVEIEEGPWAAWTRDGKPINPRGLASKLRGYGVRSRDLKIHSQVRKGYRREDLWDSWTRYLPASAEKSATSATGATSAGQSGSGSDDPSATCENVSATRYLSATPDTPSDLHSRGGSGGSASAPSGGTACDCGSTQTRHDPALGTTVCRRCGDPITSPTST